MKDYLYTRLNVCQQNVEESLLKFFVRHHLSAEIFYSQPQQIVFIRVPEKQMAPFVHIPISNEFLRAVVFENKTWILCQIEWCLFTDRDALKVSYIPLQKEFQSQIRSFIQPPTKAQKRSQFSEIAFGKPTYAAQGKCLV